MKRDDRNIINKVLILGDLIMKTKVFNNATDFKSMLQCLLYCDKPVKYISGQHPEWSVLFDENSNSIIARNNITKQFVTMPL